jgi:hypothetical protein
VAPPAVFDFRYIAARILRRPLAPECADCNDTGWEQSPYNPYAPYVLVYRECSACHNPKGKSSP